MQSGYGQQMRSSCRRQQLTICECHAAAICNRKRLHHSTHPFVIQQQGNFFPHEAACTLKEVATSCLAGNSSPVRTVPRPPIPSENNQRSRSPPWKFTRPQGGFNCNSRRQFSPTDNSGKITIPVNEQTARQFLLIHHQVRGQSGNGHSQGRLGEWTRQPLLLPLLSHSVNGPAGLPNPVQTATVSSNTPGS